MTLIDDFDNAAGFIGKGESRLKMPIAFIPPKWPQTIVEVDQLARSYRWPEADIKQLWRTHDYLSTLFSGRYRGSGRPFLSHLTGTAGLSLMLGGDLTDVLLCYAHAAFEQGEFGHPAAGPTTTNRQALKAQIGAQSEALVFGYHGFKWMEALWEADISENRSFTDYQRRLTIARILNQLDDSLDYSAYDRAWFDACIERLELGAKFLDSIQWGAAANLVRRRIEEMSYCLPICDKGFRPKRSTTLRNPAYTPRLGLRFLRFLHSWLFRLTVRIEDRK
jgi:hypothetical protein